jgi:O-antigen biosynthesis protein
VSETERELFVRAGAPRVLRLGDALAPAPTATPFAARQGVLFVGAFYEPESPNSDGIIWFVEQVWPRVRDALGDCPLHIVGPRPGRRVRALATGRIEVLGAVDDLEPLFESARVFVAPTRFAAGLPRKVLDAAARGVPVVATTLLARQLGWSAGDELEAADAPESFAAAVTLLYRDSAAWQSRRERALERIGRDYSPTAFAATLAEALGR